MTDISVTPTDNGHMDTATKPRQKRQKRATSDEVFASFAVAQLAWIEQKIADVDAEIARYHSLIADREAVKTTLIATRKVWEKRQG
jgi:hypothetical protein